MNTELEPTLDAGTLAEEDQARANVYALLAMLLVKSPNTELLTMLRQLPATGETEAEMTVAWSMLKLAADKVVTASEVAAAVAALDDEYHELFIGLGRGELVPYGSWYITGFLLEKPLAELRLDLTRLGFERQSEVREPEDHAGALCETMSMIITSGRQIPFEVQREFFHKHIHPWMGRFFNDLTQAKAARFYRAVGLVGEKFLEIERAYFAMPA